MGPNFDNVVKKNIDNSFEFIRKIESDNEYEIISADKSLNKSVAKTFIKDDKFNLAFYTNGILNQDERNTLLDSKATFTIMNKERSLVFDFKSFSHISTLIMNEPNRFNCEIRKYYNPEVYEEKDRYYRIIIPTKKEQRPGSIFQSDSVQIGSVVHFKGLVTIKYSNLIFHLYAYNKKETKEYYLIIESQFKTNYQLFKKDVEYILLAYSFITGYLPRDKRFIISAEECSFENLKGVLYDTTSKSLESYYSVFPRSDIRIYFNLPHNIDFPQDIFSKLCAILLNNQELNRVLFLVVEGHTLSTELQAAIYSIALEAITNIISEENECKFSPITDKKVSKKFIIDLKKVLDKYAESINTNGRETLIKKINVINSPTNKDKLLKPFELLKLKLNEKEIECIDKRNDFLHGRLPYNFNDDESKFKLQQISLTLLYCVTILVLKYIGYSGYVMYYPTMNEFKKKKKISDYIMKII
jgi:hypothetical protein